MMTLLTICQDAADEIGISRPSAIVGSLQTEVQKLLRYAKAVGVDQVTNGGVWEALRKERTFTSLAAAEQTAILPSDYDHMIPETFWDRTDKRLVAAVTEALQWQSLQASDYAGVEHWFYIRGGSLFIYPTPAAGHTLAFEYVSKNYCESAGGTDQAVWTADTDLPLIPEEVFIKGIKYYFLEGEGLPSASAFGEYSAVVQRKTANNLPTSKIMSAGAEFGSSRHFSGAPLSNNSYTNGNYF